MILLYYIAPISTTLENSIGFFLKPYKVGTLILIPSSTKKVKKNQNEVKKKLFNSDQGCVAQENMGSIYIKFCLNPKVLCLRSNSYHLQGKQESRVFSA